jgi:hypothetical protein
MTSVLHSIEAFFFAPTTTRGFGWMRAAWAAVTALFLIFQWNDVIQFYSNNGMFPWSIAENILRSQYHFTLLWWITTPTAVFSLYITFLGLLFLMMLGIFPRITTILCVLLMFSFHERNSMILGGGDTLLRTIGFLLMIAPGTSTFSLFKIPHSPHPTPNPLLPTPPTQPLWPYRLLLWQMIILYATSCWTKLLGSLWWQGKAVEIALHHPIFERAPVWIINSLTPIFPLIDWLSLTWEGLWILLLVPRFITNLLPPQLPRIPLKRILIIGGIVFHVSIFVLMDAGSFSLAILTAYIGLLQDDDMAWIRKITSR